LLKEKPLKKLGAELSCREKFLGQVKQFTVLWRPFLNSMAEDTGRAVAGVIGAASSMSLLMRAREGDEAARDELCARYLPRLRRWAHGRLPVWARDHLDTEDIVQDTLWQSVKQLQGFSPAHERAFCAYVCEALRNRVRDAVRRAVRRPAGEPIPEDALTDEPSPLEQAVGRETYRRYERALSRLREPERELIVARVELHLGYPEIAELHSKPTIAAARVAVSRALLRLATEMGHEPAER
jgi:RNA polymerase sigma-70 factor, ECF subfamily